MPIYEYKCTQCNNEFEELVFSDSAKVPCPACSSEKTEKLLSCCSFTSKGSDGTTTSSSAGSSCSGCPGGNCASCH